MKKILISILCFASVFAVAQDMMEPIPKELDQLKFMLGNWKGDMVFSFGGPPSKGSDASVSKMTLGGRYFESSHKYKMDDNAAIFEGRHLITFDSNKKKWIGYWFDSAAAGVMEMDGDLVNGVLTLTSKPTEMPGAPGPVIMKSVYKMVSATKIDFVMDMKMGDQWTTALKGTYTKN